MIKKIIISAFFVFMVGSSLHLIKGENGQYSDLAWIIPTVANSTINAIMSVPSVIGEKLTLLIGIN